MKPTQPARAGEESLAVVRGYLLHLARHRFGDDLRSKGDVSDLVQAALLTAHECREQFHGTSREEYRGWLRQILLNVARKFRRHWCSQARATSREVRLDTHPVSNETPSRVARRGERHQLLADALSDLPPEQQLVVALRMEEERSFGEIGERLGKSADAARMLFNRALEQLQRSLSPAECLS